MKNIIVYTGKGAYQARDVEAFLAVFDFDYKRFCEHDLHYLTSNDLLIVPGGSTNEFKEVFKRNATLITDFINNGGSYLGICAGVSDLASTGLIPDVTHQRGVLKVVVKDLNGKSYDATAENPPILPAFDNAQNLLVDQNGLTVAIKQHKGQGTIFLLAVHLEGSVFHRIDPRDNSGSQFLKNLIEDIA